VPAQFTYQSRRSQGGNLPTSSIHDKLDRILTEITEMRQQLQLVTTLQPSDAADDLEFGSLVLPLDSEEPMEQLNDILKDKAQRIRLVIIFVGFITVGVINF
jgi:hypothetical protein